MINYIKFQIFKINFATKILTGEDKRLQSSAFSNPFPAIHRPAALPMEGLLFSKQALRPAKQLSVLPGLPSHRDSLRAGLSGCYFGTFWSQIASF